MYARVELVGCASFNPVGRPSFKQGQVRYLTNSADIKFFKTQSAFNVSMLDADSAKSQAARDAKLGKVDHRNLPPLPPKGEKAEAEPDKDLPPWKPNMSVKKLTKAAEARGIAVAPGDKASDIVELLRMHDEDAGKATDEGEDGDEDDDNEGDED